ncbi:DUF4347 domain-containing protein [Stieleria sp. TO1_6]|uniref:DUF4347 domain-containing protein n=1 Tax=Stieleria tagensis TaxID=2956795 RepID=UPI00209B0794|nr:DUF4347 domain-containing protein [Stieleria tagensis]MCO8120950.1 DUF4347 domain-containing protein [Stieleria tagensis]
MAATSGARVFDFLQLEDRVLLSADGPDGDVLLPNSDAEMLDALVDQAAAEAMFPTTPDSNFSDHDADLAAQDWGNQEREALRREVVFVDQNVRDYETLVGGLREQDPGRIEWVVIEIAADSDGVKQITDSLQQLSGVDAIHLLGHSDSAGLQLGTSTLGNETLSGYAGDIASWRNAMDDGADVLIYGCDLAATQAGRDLIESIAALCDCDVSASDDPTGHFRLGGDWDLEFQFGQIETDVAFGQVVQRTWLDTLDSVPDTIVVTQSGAAGLSINQTGNDTYLISDGGLDAHLDQFTYELRFNADAFDGEQVFLSYNVGNEDELSFQLVQSGHQFELDIAAGDPLNSSAIDYVALLTDGQDHTVSVTWENQFGSWQIFVDGQSVDQGTGYQIGQQVRTNGRFVFGQEQDAEDADYDPDQNFRGVLYGARLFDDIRSPTEITANYAGGVSNREPGLIAQWDFREGVVDGVLADSVGQLHLRPATIAGGVFESNDTPLTLAVDTSSRNGTIVGQVQAQDPGRQAVLEVLLADDPGLFYSASNDKFYKLVGTDLTWDDSLSLAQSSELLGLTGQLLSIHSEGENQLVQQIAIASGQDVWLSATDRGHEGDFYWTENGTEVAPVWLGGPAGNAANGSYANFDPGQPDDFLGQDHVLLHQSDGSWDDIDGTAVAGLIIQWDADDVLDQVAPIEYSIESQSLPGAFAIDPDTGQITVADRSQFDPTHPVAPTVTVSAIPPSGVPSVQTFAIELLVANQAPTLDRVGPASVDEAMSVILSDGLLSTSDPEQLPNELQYILTTAAQHGDLLRDGVALSAGQSFTQQDVIDGVVQYNHSGVHVATDQFDFIVTDGQGAGSTGTFEFVVNLSDDPVLLSGPDAVVTDEDIAIEFGPSGVGVFDLFDEESDTLTLQLTAIDASLSAVVPFGLTQIDDDGSDGTLRWVGQQAEITQALNSLQLLTHPGFNGITSLTVSVSDASSTSIHTVEIEVAPVAHVVVWDGGGVSDDWSDPLNWDLDRVPRADDTVVFDATSGTDSVIDAAFNGAVSVIRVDTGFVGEISQQADMLVGDVHFSGGSLVTSGSDWTVLGDWIADGGTIDLNASELDVVGDFILDSAVSISNGTVRVAGDAVIAVSSWAGSNRLELVGDTDQLLSAGGGVGSIGSLTINKSDGNAVITDSFRMSGNLDVVRGGVDASGLDLILSSGSSATIDNQIGPLGSLEIDATSAKTIRGTLDVIGTTQLTNVALLNGGTIRALGDVVADDNVYSGTTTLELGGSGDQNLTTDGGRGMIRNLLINKSGGTATALEDLELAGNVTYLDGNLDTSAVTTRFTSINMVIDTGTLNFGRVEFIGFVDADIVGSLNVQGDVVFNQVFTVAGGQITTTGDVISYDATVLGNTALKLVGSGDQMIFADDLPDGDLVIDKPAGRVLLGDDLLLNGSSQNIRLVQGEIVLSGQRIETPGTVSIESGRLSGFGQVAGDLQIDSFATVVLDGTSASPSGRDQIRVSGELAISPGATLSLDVSGFSGGGLFDALIVYGNRSGQFDNVELQGNLNGWIPHLVYDDVNGVLGMFLNTPPNGRIDDIIVFEDASETLIDLAAAFDDIEHQDSDLTYALINNSDPTLFNSVTIDQANGTLAIQYAADQNGEADLTLRVSDPLGDSVDVTFHVTITAQDDRPTLVVGIIDVGEGDSVTLTAVHLEGVDIDTDPNQLIYNVVSGPSHGEVLVDGIPATVFSQGQLELGHVAYSHDDSEHFSDSITIELSDATSTLPQQTLQIVIEPRNDQSPTIYTDAGGDSASLARFENDSLVTIVQATDADLPGDVIHYSISGGSDAAEFTIDVMTGQLSFCNNPDAENPRDQNGDGVYHVIVMADDGLAADTQTLWVSVHDVNEFDADRMIDRDPSANQIDVDAATGSAVGITVQATDDDVSNNVISYSLITDDGGRFVIDPITGVVTTSGRFDWSVDAPTRQIVVRATSSDTSFVDQLIDVELFRSNTAPVARNDSWTTNASQSIQSAAPGVMANDYDPDGDSLTTILVAGPTQGTVQLLSNGQFQYTPANGFHGTDVFQYRVSDGITVSNVARVTIQVVVGNVADTGGAPQGGTEPAPSTGLPDGNLGYQPMHPGTTTYGSDGNDASGSQGGSAITDQSGDPFWGDRESQQESEAVEYFDGARQGAGAQEGRGDESSDSELAHQIESENTAFLQLVYHELFAGMVDQDIQIADSSQELRQLERLLQQDLKQAILWDMWDHPDMSPIERPVTMFIGSAGAALGLFSIGYVTWAVRGGAFLSVLASSLPSWRFIDPTSLLTAYRSHNQNTSDGVDQIMS